MGLVSEVFARSNRTHLMNRMTRGQVSWGRPCPRDYRYLAAVAIVSASIYAQPDMRRPGENFERWAKVHSFPFHASPAEKSGTRTS
jgi:hypothetical protein